MAHQLIAKNSKNHLIHTIAAGCAVFLLGITGCVSVAIDGNTSFQKAQGDGRQRQLPAVCHIRLAATHATKELDLDEHGNAISLVRTSTNDTTAFTKWDVLRDTNTGRKTTIIETSSYAWHVNTYEFTYATSVDLSAVDETINAVLDGQTRWTIKKRYRVDQSIRDLDTYLPTLIDIDTQQITGPDLSQQNISTTWGRESSSSFTWLSLLDPNGTLLSYVTFNYGRLIGYGSDAFDLTKPKARYSATAYWDESQATRTCTSTQCTWTDTYTVSWRPETAGGPAITNDATVTVTVAPISTDITPSACLDIYNRSPDLRYCESYNPKEPYSICLFAAPLRQTDVNPEQTELLKFLPTRY